MAGSWDIRRIYLYLVCFATLMMIIVGTVQVIQGVFQIVIPEPPYVYKEPPPNVETKKADLEQLRKYQAEQAKIEAKRQEIYRIRSLVTSFALLAVSVPVYMYHWRKIQHSEA